MQEKESIMIVRCQLKIASLVVTVTLVTEFSISTSQSLKILILQIAFKESYYVYKRCNLTTNMLLEF